MLFSNVDPEEIRRRAISPPRGIFRSRDSATVRHLESRMKPFARMLRCALGCIRGHCAFAPRSPQSVALVRAMRIGRDRRRHRETRLSQRHPARALRQDQQRLREAHSLYGFHRRLGARRRKRAEPVGNRNVAGVLSVGRRASNTWKGCCAACGRARARRRCCRKFRARKRSRRQQLAKISDFSSTDLGRKVMGKDLTAFPGRGGAGEPKPRRRSPKSAAESSRRLRRTRSRFALHTAAGRPPGRGSRIATPWFAPFAALRGP